MTKKEIFAKLQTEITIRGLSPGTYYTYMRTIDLFLNWSDCFDQNDLTVN